MNRSNMMKLTIDINNLGVMLLYYGRDQEAFEMFTGAIQVMMHASKGALVLPMRDTRVSRAYRILTKYQHNSSMHHQKRAERDDVVFSQGIRLPENIFHQSPVLCQLQSAIVLFNTALTLQLQPGEKGFARADSLYRMSYDLATVLHPLPDEVGSIEMLLLMGLLNNMSKLNNDLGNFTLARTLCHSLSSFISSLTVSTTSTLGKHMNRLLFNCLFLEPPTAAGAA
mmetsp:Transcript_15615/g.26095  ORF Transcript_15615/g.26095 Transcript_15615/m.26095 type:complete len:226 (-) Transcript_15615:113-790(-)|eukprot:CAMPEP_0119019448 /NCGR_PEP_ID=MMETSP1176-20130426/21840_1 /TAXON_ID=265551 /ORGANISM="Synedropsis recta cf, Strain CCMP1620" /LENGTH=225 /DNA_ID=CAMNT_0006973639 /DNA_START=55 /DNA_END=732 /DNA_ORIENTATION=+